MSPPRNVTRVCEVTQAELHAFLLDGEEPTVSFDELWSHVAACTHCARAIAHDRAMRRAIGRMKPSARAPESLRQRVVAALAKRTGSDTQSGGQSR